jgi:hypothetical protein
MTPIRFGQMIAITLALTAVCTGAHAEEKVYKWVDEDGVVHFSDAPPAEGDSSDAETLVIPKSPPVATPAQPAAKPATAEYEPCRSGSSLRRSKGKNDRAIKGS